MSELIDRQAAIEAIEPILKSILQGNSFKAINVMDEIRKLPSARPERKTGRWIVKTVNTFEMAYGSTGYEPVYECSLCGGVEESYLRFDEPIMPEDANFPNYCPNCGAKMGEALQWEEPEINPCRGCDDYDGQGGCLSNGGCGSRMEVTDG